MMGRMKILWRLFGFEWWGGLRPAEMTTPNGWRFVPLLWGLWIRRPARRANSEEYEFLEVPGPPATDDELRRIYFFVNNGAVE